MTSMDSIEMLLIAGRKGEAECRKLSDVISRVVPMVGPVFDLLPEEERGEELAAVALEVARTLLAFEDASRELHSQVFQLRKEFILVAAKQRAGDETW